MLWMISFKIFIPHLIYHPHPLHHAASCGERMSLSITAMLAALAAEIVVAAYLPACAEMTWFAKFSILSTTFAFVSLLESVIVLYFYYKKSEDMGEWVLASFPRSIIQLSDSSPILLHFIF